MVNILCISDTVDPLVYSEQALKRFRNIDCIIAAGDLPMEYLGFIASSLMKPVFFVFGNHHLSYLPHFKKKTRAQDFSPYYHQQQIIPQGNFGSTYINEKVIRFKKVLIAGLGGCKKYNSGENQFSEFEMRWKILHLLPRLVWNRIRHGRFLDILVTHAPPLGIHDKHDPCHRGFSVFLGFIKRFKPRYLLHGHIHLYDLQENRTSICYKTNVINVFGHYVLTIK